MIMEIDFGDHEEIGIAVFVRVLFFRKDLLTCSDAALQLCQRARLGLCGIKRKIVVYSCEPRVLHSSKTGGGAFFSWRPSGA